MAESQSAVNLAGEGNQLETTPQIIGSMVQLPSSQPISAQSPNTQGLDAFAQAKNNPASEPETQAGDVELTSEAHLTEETASKQPNVTDTGQGTEAYSHHPQPTINPTDIKKSDESEPEPSTEKQAADPGSVQVVFAKIQDAGSHGTEVSLIHGPVHDHVSNIGEADKTSVPDTSSSEQCQSVPDLTVCDRHKVQGFIGPVIPTHLKITHEDKSLTEDTPSVLHSKRKSDNDAGILTHQGTGRSSPTAESDCKKPKFHVQNVEDSNRIYAVDTETIVDAKNEISVVMDDLSRFDNDFSRPPTFLTSSVTEFEKVAGNFLKGCKWSPDGTCLLTNSDDNQLRLFNLPQPLYTGKAVDLPEMKAVLCMAESELIYDYCWLPGMSSYEPDTCAIVSTSRDTPVHMWDAFTGKLRCSYRSFDNADDLTAAHSLAFSLDGKKMYCGFNKMIRVFDVNRPGRECVKRPTFVKQGQPGIISCIAMNPSDQHLYAAGSYSRTIALYADQGGDMLCMFLGQQGGVTHIIFSPDGTKLYSGGRKDPEILCWDIRNPGEILFTTKRNVATNQRIYLDLDATGRYLMSGNHDGSVHVWDTLDPSMADEGNSEPVVDPAITFQAHNDTVNGISLHPTMPILATASGQRHFSQPGGSDSSESESDTESDGKHSGENSLKLWWVGK